MISTEDYDLLTRYSGLDGTEIGGYVCELLCLRDNSEPHGMSKDFSIALDSELLHWLARFKNETTIVTKSEPQPNRVFEELEWR